jgi:hypothetical protein
MTQAQVDRKHISSDSARVGATLADQSGQRTDGYKELKAVSINN